MVEMTLSSGSDVYASLPWGHGRDMRRATLCRAILITLLSVLTAWPVSAAASEPVESAARAAQEIRQTVAHIAVRVEVEGSGTENVCTGWIGWSEEGRSAAYTAAHCYRAGARYRLIVAGGDPVYATSLARWDGLDLMVLWFPRGHLPALRIWKPLPAGAFRAVYALSEHGAPLRLVDVAIPRVYWEIRFQSHPLAVALPLTSAPGTSGAPVVDLADGALIGMIVGFALDRPELAAVVPAQSIYDALTTATRR